MGHLTFGNKGNCDVDEGVALFGGEVVDHFLAAFFYDCVGLVEPGFVDAQYFVPVGGDGDWTWESEFGRVGIFRIWLCHDAVADFEVDHIRCHRSSYAGAAG